MKVSVSKAFPDSARADTGVKKGAVRKSDLKCLSCDDNAVIAPESRRIGCELLFFLYSTGQYSEVSGFEEAAFSRWRTSDRENPEFCSVDSFSAETRRSRILDLCILCTAFAGS